MKLVAKYFPDLTENQIQRLDALVPLYQTWNEKINVISRQDVENLEERHILHSLAIAKIITFKYESNVLDLGTGGGFPGIPLAILFPNVHFVLVDGTGKKIKVVEEVVHALQLENVTAIHGRAEEIKLNSHFDFIITRGVATLDKLLNWSRRLLKKKHMHVLPNGILALKGGNLKEEIGLLPGKGENYSEIFRIKKYFQEPFFEEKAIIYVQG